jgi:hypothetical protein
MYGYDLPRYVREYEAEWKRFDRFLRVRRSFDNPGAFVIERKSKYLFDHPFRYNTDAQIQYKDDYRAVLTFWPCDITAVMPHLRKFDLQRMGAKTLAREIQEREEYDEKIAEKDRMNELDAVGSEAYDFLAWREGRRVAT